ncbi:MAG: c-type cytochrome domain-containing protein, partial [Planctomycetota bacterium]|nr:c-type cytochrome domain-containing protein [Planctomycetota bacterium]
MISSNSPPRPRSRRLRPAVPFLAALASPLAVMGWQDTPPMGMDDLDPGMGMGMGMGDDTAFSQDQIHFFESEVRPLLIGACGGCHSDNGSRIRAGFKIDSREAMLAGCDSGPAIVPGD